MRLKVECDHGVTREVEDPAQQGGTALRLLVRDLLLACPQCHFAAGGMLEEGQGA